MPTIIQLNVYLCEERLYGAVIFCLKQYSAHLYFIPIPQAHVLSANTPIRITNIAPNANKTNQNGGTLNVILKVIICTASAENIMAIGLPTARLM